MSACVSNMSHTRQALPSRLSFFGVYDEKGKIAMVLCLGSVDLGAKYHISSRCYAGHPTLRVRTTVVLYVSVCVCAFFLVIRKSDPYGLPPSNKNVSINILVIVCTILSPRGRNELCSLHVPSCLR